MIGFGALDKVNLAWPPALTYTLFDSSKLCMQAMPKPEIAKIATLCHYPNSQILYYYLYSPSFLFIFST